MAMSLIIDTHRFIEELKTAGFTPAQAEGLVRALQKSDLNHLTTKADLKELELRLVKWIIAVVGIGVAVMALIMDFQLGR